MSFGGSKFFADAGLPSGQYDAVIVNGTGLGQHRKIVSCSGTTVTVAPAWNVAPDGSSTVIFAGVVSHCAIYHNTLQGKSTYATQETASAGIQPFGNSYDFIADGNTISQVRNGIYVWGMTAGLSPQSINCAYFNYIANNATHQCLNGTVIISRLWNNWAASDPYPGISVLGNICTSNTADSITDNGFVQSANPAPPGDQMDLNVFAHNSVVQGADGARFGIERAHLQYGQLQECGRRGQLKVTIYRAGGRSRGA